MLELIKGWYQQHFSDPQVAILALIVLGSLAVVLLLGDILAPVLFAILFTYLLDGLVSWMERLRIPRAVAATVVLLAFLVFSAAVILGLVPVLFQQVGQLIRAIPGMLVQGQDALLRLPEFYPSVFTQAQIEELLAAVRVEVASWGQAVLSLSLNQLVNLIAFVVYAILVPLMVFFGLKDKHKVLGWLRDFLPRRRQLSTRIWTEVDQKIANYVRGKFIEILIVWSVSFVTFSFMGLNFSLLLSFLVGISVIIPYVGAVAVTFPVALIAYFQWGISPEFGYLLGAYFIIQALDGNLLVPLLFSEVVNLHPIAIIVAVLFFGGLWGVWGVFFAIPLATLVQAILNAMLKRSSGESATAEATSSL